MKNIILIIVISLFASSLFAQTEILFTYNASGDRTSKQIIGNIPETSEIEGETNVLPNSEGLMYSVEETVNSEYIWTAQGGTIENGDGTNQIFVNWGENNGTITVLEINEAGCNGEEKIIEISTDVLTQHFIFPETGWYMVSFYVQLEDSSPEVVFAPIIDKVVKIKDEFYSFDPNNPPSMNTLTALEAGQGYFIRVSEACSIDIEGLPVNTEEISIQLQTGWNLIGYPCAISQDIENAYTSINPVLLKVKNILYSYDPNIPTFFNTLHFTESGEGYWVKVSEHTTFVYPTSTENKFIPKSIEWYWKPTAYLQSTIAYAKVTFNEESISEDAQIAVFVGNECRAVGKVSNNNNESFVSLVINGTEQEQCYFKLWHNGKEYYSDYTVLTQPTETLPNILPLNFGSENTINQLDNSISVNVFPNPFTQITEIYFTLNSNQQVSATVYSAEGILISQIANNEMKAGKNKLVWNAENISAGMYFLKIKTENNIYTTKIIKQ